MKKTIFTALATWFFLLFTATLASASTDFWHSDVFYSNVAYGSIGAPELIDASCDGVDTDKCEDGRVFNNASDILECDDDGASIIDICNGIDDDCDGEIDEDYLSVSTACGFGACRSTGFTFCVEGAVGNSCIARDPLSDVDETCDGIDDDCNGETDEDYLSIATDCGVGACSSAGSTSCVEGTVGDSCTENEPLSLTDDTCNAIDDDCDGADDEDYSSVACDGEQDTDLCQEGTTSCETGTVLCSDNTDSTVELCNGLDDDCDELVDEGLTFDDDVDGFTSVGSCEGSANDCNDDVYAIKPGAEEVCDGVDNNCSGFIDDDPSNAPVFFADVDEDGYGDPDVSVQACDQPVDYVTDNTDAFPDNVNEWSDSDDDAMGDNYETDHDLNILVNDAFMDKDLDGYCNLREFLSGSLASVQDEPLPIADSDFDNDIDAEDLDWMKYEYGRLDCSVTPPCLFDFDKSNAVDEIDLKLFSEDYGRALSPGN